MCRLNTGRLTGKFLRIIVQHAGDTFFCFPHYQQQLEIVCEVWGLMRRDGGQKTTDFPTRLLFPAAPLPVSLAADLSWLLYKYCGREGEGQQEQAAPPSAPLMNRLSGTSSLLQALAAPRRTFSTGFLLLKQLLCLTDPFTCYHCAQTQVKLQWRGLCLNHVLRAGQ